MYATLPSPLVAKPIHSFSVKKTVTVRNSAQAASFKSATVRNLAGSLYEILKVERTASLNEIKMAYRSLAKVYHPDAMGSKSDGGDFIEIRNAYATLSDPTARAVYDMSLGARARRVGNWVYPIGRWETDQCW
ncbi:Transducin/WD40 repeat-like superfamily protein, putative isoform 1 [Hibiscus syriacus]|uniref:Transducin/WD40 repeat-like superfamily protein, putative isoform 1 n=1 Tax=Hibiscus syriacus TaxID=106335 RepID=A0A6A3BB68_HIBSY|nr:chaperone protein dnaJ 11, chloroplastic-like [Hibiscus syriacus]KAE8713733.1 Transducin/WD40 repeat-like superfamily protein, putative isoform 1 [Hibiscus syriacus]